MPGVAVPEPRVLHVVVGPEEHGVVRHGRLVAEASGHRLLRLDQPGPVPPEALDEFDVVHLPFTDRLFAPTCEAAVEAFAALVGPVRYQGLAVSVTLHDLPAGDSAVEQRRRAAYGQVVALARGVVVNSGRELELLGDPPAGVRSVRLVPLPVEAVDPPDVLPPTRWTSPDDVVVLGFLFPDRGYEQVVAALPPDARLVALGRPSQGHDDLAAHWVEVAAAAGHELTVSGFVLDADLAAELWAAGVPVAPNRRVAASGSIGTWVGHGRRPLVPATPYTRELDRRWPGTLTLYDPDDPAALAHAVAAALADPDSTWIAPGTPRGTGLAEVVTAYGRHFLGCRPDAPIPVGDGRWTVPGNRWDLLPPAQPGAVPVSVVVPYFESQQQLDLVLTGLTLQDHRNLEVIVADDGSAEAPSLAAADDLPVTLVQQDREGFRAAAARNLGARAASGEVLLFLDGDTVPEPGYVSAMAARLTSAPDLVTVGRRRHADLTGWDPIRLARWFGSREHATDRPPELDEPGWLADAYEASGDLLDADARSYRYLISAVLGVHRDLFAEVGGFDERFRAYGGEDWELAHRLWVAGALLAHVREAVAWHDGPDWAGRPADRRAGQNAQTLALSRLLPDPVARGGGQWVTYPATVVRLGFGDAYAVLAAARSAFAHDTDCGVWVGGDAAEAAATVTALDDPRIHVGAVPDDVRARAVTVVDVPRPQRLLDLGRLIGRAQTYGPLVADGLTVTPTRALTRTARWCGDTDLALTLFGGRDVVAPPETAPVDLAHELKQVYESVRRS